MNTRRLHLLPAVLVFVAAIAASGEVTVTVDRNSPDDASAAFKFQKVPSPARNDAAAGGTFLILDGSADSNGARVEALGDGRLPGGEDEPGANFFFAAGTPGGRVMLDLGKLVSIRQINTYSWHANSRGPQVYVLHASSGTNDGFTPRPAPGTNLAATGWVRLAAVDTRPTNGETGGQYAVSLGDSNRVLGPFRYLLFDIGRTEGNDPFGNTFFSEIDVLDAAAPPPEVVGSTGGEGALDVVETGDGKFRITIDTTEAADLTSWVRTNLIPVVREWYPKVVELLPSDGYNAPPQVRIFFSRDMQGVADTSGSRIRCAARWFRANLKGEATGSVVHELVHVVQQYGRNRRLQEGAVRPPGWLVEGLADYVRWFVYEPQSRGAEISRRGLENARYNGSYRVTANFLNWATTKYDKNLPAKLNAAMREGRYNEEIWKTATGHSLPELGAEWKMELEQKLGAAGSK